jgi:hypothetical protein
MEKQCVICEAGTEFFKYLSRLRGSFPDQIHIPLIQCVTSMERSVAGVGQMLLRDCIHRQWRKCERKTFVSFEDFTAVTMKTAPYGL